MVYTNPFRNMTVGNFFFILIMLFASVFGISYLSSQFFGTGLIKIGTPLNVLIVASGLTIVFYTVIKKQGAFDRNDILALILLIGGFGALFYYLPKLLPEIFSALPTQSITSSPTGAVIYNNTFVVMKDAATQIHDFVQAVIPIP